MAGPTSMTCDDFRAASLTPPQDAAAQAHAASCEACRLFAEQVGRNERLLRALSKGALPLPKATLPAGLWDRLERRLPPVRRPAPLRTWMGLAAAAALLVAAVTTALRHQAEPQTRLSIVVVEAPAAPEDGDREDLAEYASLGGGQGVQYIDAGGGD